MNTTSVSVVTGAASGLGFQFTRSLLKAGSRVCLLDKNNDLLQRKKEELLQLENVSENSIFTTVCDVTDKDKFKKALEETESFFSSPITVLCNNAGMGNESDLDLTVDLNLKSVMYGTNLGIELMKKNKVEDGVIVNVASMGGIAIMPYSPIYAGTKAGVIHFSRSIAKAIYQSSKKSIRVNTLCPTFTSTPLLEELMAVGETERAVVKSLGKPLEADYVSEKGFMKLVLERSLNAAVCRVQHDGVTLQRYKSEI